MNPSIQLKTTIVSFVIAIVLTYFGLLPKVQAVVPAPDGGYPNFTTAEGQNALLSLSTGVGNTAVGSFSLESVITGSFNTGVGAFALVLNTGDNNTATGAGALLLNDMGHDNTANGTATLVLNSTGIENTAVGAFALNNNTTGGDNTAVGYQALFSNTELSLGNTAIGAFALFSNQSTEGNTAVGLNALVDNTTGFNNTAVGNSALDSSTGGSNTALGAFAGIEVTTASNVICIGIVGANVDDSCFIGNVRDVTTQNDDAIGVVVDSAGQLGTVSSSRRFKKDIQPMDKASEAVLALKPVTFRYKNGKKGTPQFGLIAEDVANVNPDLVVRDKSGEIYTVRYDAVNAMLLNEFLKEHKKVEEQQTRIGELGSRVATQERVIAQQQEGLQLLTEQLKDQAAQIQRVTAQMQLNSSRRRVVVSDQ
jgi:uncharacterized coiled-coil protein SlyX